MLLYRYAKMMEEQNARGSNKDHAEARIPDLKEMRSKMEEIQLALMEEDCTDWAVEATY
jgi:hypothetical protein